MGGSAKASIRAVVLSLGCISKSLGAAFKKMPVPGFYPKPTKSKSFEDRAQTLGIF